MGYLEDLMDEAKKKPAKAETPALPEIEPLSLPKPAPSATAPKIIEEEVPKPEAPTIEIAGTKKLISSYGAISIYKVEGEPLPVYVIPITKPMGPEKVIVNTIKEAATRLITVSPEEIRDPQARRDFYFKRIKEIVTASPELGVPPSKIDFYADMVVRDMIGYGLLDTLVQDDKLEEIMVIGPSRPVYVFHRQYGMLKTNVVFGTDEEVQNIVSRIAREVNRRVDVQNPLLDARLPDGSRVNATIKPISLGGTTVTIRKFSADPLTIVDLMKYQTMNSEVAAFLWMAVDGLGAKPANILIAGGTGCGKTTTLNVLASFIPPRERIVTIEDTAELLLPVEHWIRFESRPPGLEMTGEITMDMLVKNSLRMRPDRIIVGEIRHAEAFTLFTAINTGHQGSMGTVHANSAQETLTRLMNPPMDVPPIMIGALDFVVMQQRIHDPKRGTMRRITEIAEVIGVVDNKPQIQLLYVWDPITDTVKPTGNTSRYMQELQRFTGLSKNDMMAELDRRKKIMEGLLARGPAKMTDVAAELQKYRVQQWSS
jgi:flagellar protein FlaI